MVGECGYNHGVHVPERHVDANNSLLVPEMWLSLRFGRATKVFSESCTGANADEKRGSSYRWSGSCFLLPRQREHARATALSRKAPGSPFWGENITAARLPNLGSTDVFLVLGLPVRCIFRLERACWCVVCFKERMFTSMRFELVTKGNRAEPRRLFGLLLGRTRKHAFIFMRLLVQRETW